MIKKVAVDKKEIDKLIRIRKYKEAKEMIAHIRDVITLCALKRVDALIEHNVILKEEKEGFIELIEENIVSKILEEKDYIEVDESYVDLMEKKQIDFDCLKKKLIKRRLKV